MLQVNMQQLIAAIPAAVAPTVTVNAPAGVAQATRLPQRQIRHFKGDILEWTSFWESFNTAVHSSSLSTVQKFDYLKEYLKGEARLFVENLELTDANYQIAIDELQKTYGKKEVLISAHFEKLDSLQPVRDAKDVAALRNLQLTIQSHLSALETLGKGKSTYGSLLGTKLIKLVPYKLQEKWSEVETNDSTDIDCVLKFIRDQTEAAERFGRLKVAEKPKQAKSNPQPKQAPPPATASQLATGARMNSANPVKPNQKAENNSPHSNTGPREASRPCIFCNQGHWPSKCPKNLKERKAVIAELQRCTNCFGTRHANKDCTSPRNCNRCGGLHHTALCERKDTRFSDASGAGATSSTVSGNAATITTACASIFGDIVLKTATVFVIGPDGREKKTILFADKGSHRTWVLKSSSRLRR
jgi:hypothetical protein